MIGNILKRDLKRKKTMNVIILLFVVLASLFVASSVNNIITVINGTNYFFEKAGIGDYNIITMGEDVIGKMDDFLENTKEIKSYQKEEVVYVSGSGIKTEGNEVEIRNIALLQSLEDSNFNFFGEDNIAVNSVESGYIYATSDLLEKNNLKIGDKLTIELGSVEKTFIIKGRLKDALLGSTFMGNTRLLVNSEDYQEYVKDPENAKKNRGEVCYIYTDDVKTVANNTKDLDGIAFSGDKSLLKMCYVMDMVVAGVLMVVSICLIIVAFVVLKFTITFTLSEEFREIGVMKAIGIRDFKIRSIYLIKYLAISIVGSIIGLVGSIPFGNALISSVSTNIVLGNNGGILVNVISVIFVVIVVVAYAFACTGKIKKSSPLDAIRNGQTGERFGKKSKLRLLKSNTRPIGYMALNDVLSSPKRYLTIIIAFAICTLLVFVLVNTTETMDSDGLIESFAKPSDVYYNDVDKVMSSVGKLGLQDDGIHKEMKLIEEELADNGYDAKVSIVNQFNYKVDFAGESQKIRFEQGINTKTTDYTYYKGDAPKNVYEVAITERIKDKIGADIGDTIKVTINGNTEEYLIVGYFETMNNFGELIRLHEDAEIGEADWAASGAFQIDFSDNPTEEEIADRVEKIKKIYDTDDVYDAHEFTVNNMGVLDTMKGVQFMLLIITLVVVVLVTVLMERSFISDEKGEIAILKAVGFKDRSVIGWHVLRFVIVSVISILIAVALAIPATQLTITPIFRMMGMHSVTYSFNLVAIGIIYPAIILAVMVVSATLTAQYTRKITCADTASIE